MNVINKFKYRLVVISFCTTLVLSLVAIRPAFADTATQQWMQQYAPANTSANREVKIGKDNAGNTYVDGDVQDSQGYYKVTLVKYDPDSNRLWAVTYGNSGQQNYLSGLTVSPSGDSYVLVGSDSPFVEIVKYDSNGSKLWESQFSAFIHQAFSKREIQVDSLGNVYIVGGTNGAGLVTAKFDSNGNQLWSKQSSGGIGHGVALALDASGAVYSAGYIYDGSANHGQVVKYDTNGNQLWKNTYNSGSNDQFSDVTIDPSGNVYATGLTESQSGQGYPQAYLTIKYDNNGNQQWFSTYGYSGYYSGANAIKVDSYGNVYVTGTGSSGGFVMATVKYNNNGSQLWANRYNYLSQDQGTSLELDSNENVLVGGSGYTNATSYDFVIVKYAANGNQKWVTSLDNGGWDTLRDMTLDGIGNIYATGNSCDINAQSCKLITVKYNEDTTPPTVTGTPDSQPNSNGWYNHNVTINWLATDPDSTATTPLPTLAATEGQNVTYTSGQSCDPSNNCATGSLNLSIDKTPPTITPSTWTTNPLQQGQTTILSTTASDSLSGVANVQYSIDDGPPQAMTFDYPSGTWKATFGASLAVNTYNITITATDLAGNTSAPISDILAVYSPSNGYVTGHAKTLPTTSDTLPIALDTSNNPTKLVLGFTNVTSPASGSFDLNYIIKNNKDAFSLSSAGINWIVVQDSTHASILGHGDLTTYVNGVQTVTQNVAVRFDIVLGTSGSADHVTIKLFHPGDDPTTATPAFVISDDVIANGSNLMIHP